MQDKYGYNGWNETLWKNLHEDGKIKLIGFMMEYLKIKNIAYYAIDEDENMMQYYNRLKKYINTL
jgi:hypothetical protein